jgi:hypothetical protein
MTKDEEYESERKAMIRYINRRGDAYTFAKEHNLPFDILRDIDEEDWPIEMQVLFKLQTE